MRRLLLIVLLVACSKEQPVTTTVEKPVTPPPSVAEARELIANSAELGDFQFTDASYSINVSAPPNDTTKKLIAAGWLNKDLSLAAKAQSDKRFLLRPNGILDIVPLAKKEMGDVSHVNADPPYADFTWKWIPNEVGALMPEKFERTRHARAELLWDGTSWSVLKIESSLPPLAR